MTFVYLKIGIIIVAAIFCVFWGSYLQCLKAEERYKKFDNDWNDPKKFKQFKENEHDK